MKTLDELKEDFAIAMDYGDFYVASEIVEEIKRLEEQEINENIKRKIH